MKSVMVFNSPNYRSGASEAVLLSLLKAREETHSLELLMESSWPLTIHNFADQLKIPIYFTGIVARNQSTFFLYNCLIENIGNSFKAILLIKATSLIWRGLQVINHALIAKWPGKFHQIRCVTREIWSKVWRTMTIFTKKENQDYCPTQVLRIRSIQWFNNWWLYRDAKDLIK